MTLLESTTVVVIALLIALGFACWVIGYTYVHRTPQKVEGERIKASSTHQGDNNG